MEKWTDNAALRTTAFKHMQSRLHQQGLLSPFEAENDQPWTLENLKKITSSIPFKMADCDGLDDFKNRFDAWLEVEYPEPIAFMNVTVQITRHYGAVDITFGQTAAFDDFITDRQAYAALTARLQMIHDEYARVNQLQLAANNSTATAAQFVDFEPTILSHDFTDGKHSFKLKGAPYDKWGVRIWDEVLVANHINPADVPMGENKCTGKASILMKDGKPQKVSKLTNFVLQLELEQ